jgi:hypothetical protein
MRWAATRPHDESDGDNLHIATTRVRSSVQSRPLAVPTLDYQTAAGLVGPQSPIETAPEPLPGERAFYLDRSTLITDARFVLLGKTYVVANVASIRVRSIPAAQGLTTFVLSLLAVVTTVASTSLMISDGPLHLIIGLLGLVIVGVLFYFAIFVYQSPSNKPSDYALIVATSAGAEIEVLRSAQHDYVAAILDAMNQAVVARR